jgi:zinc protease
MTQVFKLSNIYTMINRLLFILLLVSLPFPSFAKTFGAESFTLGNGMQVVVIPNHRAPIISHMIWIKVGGADNEPGKSGMAHYFEHLMFKGTPTLAAGEFSKKIKTLGGNDNAFTGQDYTAYFESVAVENLEEVMKMEADRMVNLAPPPEHFKSEKAVVLEERRQRTENDPRALFSEQLNSVLFVNHPYGTPVVGWMDEIEKYEWADVKKYYDRWYAPNNAILVVSGDITAEKLKPLAEKYYGSLPKKDLPPRLRSTVPPAPAPAVLTLEHPSIHQPLYQQLWLVPTEAKNRQDSLALQVLAEILDGGPTTRLYKNLAVDTKKATSVFFSYNSSALDYGSITMGGTPSPDVSVEALADLLDMEIAKVRNEGVTDKEVADAVQRLQDEAVFLRDSVMGPAMIFGQALSTGSTIDDVENWPEDIGKITAADVKRVAQTYLDPAKPWIRPPVKGFMTPVKKPSSPAAMPPIPGMGMMMPGMMPMPAMPAAAPAPATQTENPAPAPSTQPAPKKD